MALIKFLKRKKEQIDQAIPDFNIRQKAGQAVKSVGRTVSNIERGSQQFGRTQRSRLDSALVAQRQRQTEQANLRREREAEARARKLEQSQRRLNDLRAKQKQRNADREFKSKMAAQGIGGGRQFRKELFNVDNIRKSTGQALYENKPLKIARGVADFGAPITTGRNFIRTTGQALGAGIEEFGLRKEQKAIDKENKTISKISDPKEALRRSQANSEKARKLTMLREEKRRTVNVPKVLSDTALFAADTALSATGAKAAIKTGKPVAKQVFKEAVKRSGQRAGIGAGFGAGTSISEGERDVKQIAKQAGISAAANVALGGAIDVAPKVISKGAKSIQTALEQPKFKPGFAKIKSEPKVKLKTEAPKDIPGFTPAPEAKTPQATRIQASDLKVKSQAQPTKNIVVKSKNASVPSLTEADVNQIARNTKRTPQEVVDSYGALSNRISEISKKPIGNIQASLTSFIRDPKKWDNQFSTPQKVLTSERLDIPEPKVETPAIKLATKKSSEELAREAIGVQDTQKVIREKVFGREPALKPSQSKLTKPETFEDTITRVTSESAENAKKQPIIPEMPPVARVSTKEDISVSPEVKLDDRFTIKTTVDGKERINYDKLIDFSTKINDEKSKNALVNRIGLEAERIGAEYTKRTGKGFDNFVDELESGSLDSKAIDLYDEVSNLFNAGNKISTIRNNQITGNITNYFRRIKKEGLEKILTEGSQRNLGDILYTPGFGKKRTGALVDYEKTPAVIRAYFDEAIGPISKEQNALVKTANQIKNQINKSEIVDKDGVIKPTSSIKYVQTIKDNINATAQNKYNDVKKAIIPGVRSVKNRVFQLADKQFYNDFLKPFNNAQRDYNNALQNATKLSEVNVKSLAQGLGIKIPDKVNKEQLLLRIAGEYKKQYYGPATETFMKNVANADIKEPNGLQLLEDIAETYIGTEVKKNKFIDKLTGEIRLGYARGALGLNVGSAINNVLELKKVLSRAGIKNSAGAIKDYIAGVDLRNKYGVATTSNIFRDEAFNLLKKVDPVLFSLFDFSENTKNRLFLSSLEKLGKKKGLQEDDLEYFVLKNFEQYGLAGGRAEDIGLFTGGKRPLTKTAFQFLQYPIKDTVAFADALSNGLKKAVKDKKLNEDLSYAMVYGLTSVAQMAILSQIIGQKGFGSQTGFTPFDFLKQISSGDVTGPGTDAIIKLGTWVNEIMQPESDKKEEKVKKAQTDMNRTFLMGVVPAYNQAWNRTGRYLQDRNRGYFETGSGNVANLVTDDVWGKIRAIILGGSYDPERQKYFVESQKSKSPNLGKQESAIFREVKEKGGIESAKQYFNSIMGKREADKALKSLEEGANAEKPAGMSDEEWTKIKATNEAYILSGLATTDDFINYYARDIDFGKSGAERTKNETKVFSLVNKLDSEDKFKQLSSEQKQEVSDKLLEKSGVSRTVVDYYNKANNTVVVKYQMALEEIEDNLSKNPNFDIFNYLKESRRKINTKQFASQDVLKMLEQDGIISNDEYKVLNKINFLYLDGEFKDRSVAVKLKGKGKGKGKKPPKITLSRLMAGQQRLSDTQKIKGDLELVKLKSKPKIAAINLRKQTPAAALRLAPVRKAKPKRLTIKNIRVK
jgi:hypothetical protein